VRSGGDGAFRRDVAPAPPTFYHPLPMRLCHCRATSRWNARGTGEDSSCADLRLVQRTLRHALLEGGEGVTQ
jgi:hypothetical protein